MRLPPTILAGVMMLVTTFDSHAGDSTRVRIGRLAEKDSITILVTDSGLGGLSVCADLERRLREGGVYRKARILFANALPEANRGYNRMATTAEKVEVFDAALNGMARWYAPDAILVACNTLSVLIPETRFSRANPTPVLGIVETGVEMLYERLHADPRAIGIIFGTETTIGMGTHKRLLVERGIDSLRLVTQACPNLAGKIEEDAGGEVVRTAISGFVAMALEQASGTPDTAFAGLCCTHYGYSGGFFEESFREKGVSHPVLVDPNARMSEVLFPPGSGRRTDRPEILVEVVSRAVITSEEATSIGGLLEPVSPATAQALRSYELKKDLFPYTPH
jgi:glutamate racemase